MAQPTPNFLEKKILNYLKNNKHTTRLILKIISVISAIIAIFAMTTLNNFTIISNYDYLLVDLFFSLIFLMYNILPALVHYVVANKYIDNLHKLEIAPILLTSFLIIIPTWISIAQIFNVGAQKEDIIFFFLLTPGTAFVSSFFVTFFMEYKKTKHFKKKYK